MASTRYGAVPYGTTFYGGDVARDFVSASFTASSNGYGRVFVSWSRPGGAWDRQMLVRSLVGVPIDERDGLVLLDQLASDAEVQYDDGAGVGGSFYGAARFDESRFGSETGGVPAPLPGQFYYYALFVRGLDGMWRRTGSASVLTTTDAGYTNRLYSRLPEVFRSNDSSSLAVSNLPDEETFLFRWLSVLGFQLDHIRTELESLRGLYDARTVSATLLPALARQVGVEYEPELGDRAVRRLAANAARLWAVKGSLAGARQMATVYTGWDAAVRIGSNIALDRLDAGPDGGVGRWTGRANATTSYLAFPDNDRGPAGLGAVVITAVAGGTTGMTVDLNPAGLAKPLERLQYAVPIVAGLPYAVAQAVRTTAGGLQARVGITWLGRDGVPLGAVSYGPLVTVANDWTARPAHSQVAPVDARYLEYSLDIEGTVVTGTVVRACALTINENFVIGPWAPAREVVVYLNGDLINYVGNTSGQGLSPEGWESAFAAAADNDPSFYYLSFAQSISAFDATLGLIDAFTVPVPGDVSPDETLPEPPQGPFVAVYTAGSREVSSRETWSVLVDVAGRVGQQTRNVEVGFALYDGPNLIGYDFAPPTPVGMGTSTLSHQYVIPDNASFDRVAFAIRSNDIATTWRRTTMSREQLADMQQFDGSTPSATFDYLWEGVPFRSPAHFYHRRAVKAARLRELLVDFLPHPASFRIVFASPVVAESPRASIGTDLDPDDSQVTTIGRRARTRWRVTKRVGKELSTPWGVRSLQVGRNLSLRWELDQLNATSTLLWRTQALEQVSRDATLDWGVQVNSVGNNSTLRWNTQETVFITDALVVD